MYRDTFSFNRDTQTYYELFENKKAMLKSLSAWLRETLPK